MRHGRQLVNAAPIRYLALIVLLPWCASAQPAATPRPRIGIALEGGGALGLAQFFPGGPVRLSAYGINELRTDQYWLARLGHIHELFRLPLMLGNWVYATAAYEMAGAYGAPGSSRLPNDGSAGLVAETLPGALFVGGNLGDSEHRKVYFLPGKL
jgi:hypothetical protein